MSALHYFLLFIGPGSLFAYLFFIVGEGWLTWVFDEKYFRFGKGISFSANAQRILQLPAKLIHQEKETYFIRLPLLLIFGRLILKDGKAEIKNSYFHWLAQPFIFGTTSLFILNGQSDKALQFFAGLEFLLGGFHLQCFLKIKQYQREFSG